MRAGWTWPRWISLCAAALVLFQLGSTLHLAVAPHGVCWEHGVVVDLDAASVTHDGPAPASRPGLARSSEPAVRSDVHPHCPALWVLRAGQTRAVVSAAPVAPSEAREPALARAAQHGSSGWTLLRAPKQSPPA